MLPVLLSALLFTADPAAPATPAVSEPAPTAEKKKERKICVTEQQVTGSHRPRRTCRTAAEWARARGDHSSDDGPKAVGSH